VFSPRLHKDVDIEALGHANIHQLSLRSIIEPGWKVVDVSLDGILLSDKQNGEVVLKSFLHLQPKMQLEQEFFMGLNTACST